MSYDEYDESEEEVEEVDEVEEEEGSEEEEEEKPVKKARKQKKWKDPSKPKRALSAFFIYSQEMRPQVKASNPGVSFGDCARILAADFKNLPPKEKAKYEKKAAQDKERYKAEMADYVPMEDPTSGKRKKKKKDPNAPKKALSAYFLFSMEERPRVKAENPDIKFGDVARTISARYKAMSASERAKWDKKAAAEKERYAREMAEYRS